ncbi:MAG: hypothetical protein ACE5F5_00840 [Acidimicrobiia bacterium]
MTERDHPVDDALRLVAGFPEPTAEDRRLAEERLVEAIAAEQARSGRRLRLRVASRRVVGWAAAFVAILVGVLLLIEAVNPTATEAAMEEIAVVAEATDPLVIPDQQFLYTRSEISAISVIPREALKGVRFDGEFLVYLLPTIRETWIGSEGTVQIRTTNQPPSFFANSDETAYYAAGIDRQDSIGETTTLVTSSEPALAQWPTDDPALDRAIRQAARPDRGLPDHVEYLDVALDILREVFTPPDLRATTLRLIGQLSDLNLVETTNDGAATFDIEYTNQNIPTRLTFTISGQGYLLFEEIRILKDDPRFGIPANTSVSTAEYSTPRIIPSLDTP